MAVAPAKKAATAGLVLVTPNTPETEGTVISAGGVTTGGCISCMVIFLTKGVVIVFPALSDTVNVIGVVVLGANVAGALF